MSPEGTHVMLSSEGNYVTSGCLNYRHDLIYVLSDNLVYSRKGYRIMRVTLLSFGAKLTRHVNLFIDAVIIIDTLHL